MSEEIKACQCGASGDAIRSVVMCGGCSRIYCSKCGMNTGDCDTEDIARRTWNRRASPWINVKDKLHPDKPGLKAYEQIPCLVIYEGDIMCRQWNCEHEVWDGEDGDDFFCKATEITHWMPIPPMEESK